MRYAPAVVRLALCAAALLGCGESTLVSAPTEAVIVVSPHPDDESIVAAATIHRLAADPNRYLHVIYMSSGDRATKLGPCNGIPEKQKIAMIIALRENEARAAWQVMAPTRDLPIDFLHGPDSR